jgi:hypothetical protein
MSRLRLVSLAQGKTAPTECRRAVGGGRTRVSARKKPWHRRGPRPFMKEKQVGEAYIGM